MSGHYTQAEQRALHALKSKMVNATGAQLRFFIGTLASVETLANRREARRAKQARQALEGGSF